MTGAQIIEQLEIISQKDSDINVASFAYGDIPNPLPSDIGEWEEVEQKGGEEQGSDWYSVKYFKDHDVYIRTDGFYQSYNGTDFDDYDFGQEVTLQQKTITVYE